MNESPKPGNATAASPGAISSWLGVVRAYNLCDRLLTARLLCDGLGEKDLSARLESASARVVKEGKVRTSDRGGTASTRDVATEIATYAGSGGGGGRRGVRRR